MNMDTKMSDAPSCGESNKRAKLSTDLPPHIGNLPDSVLLNTVSYLQETSRVLLAVALTASSATWQKEQYIINPSDSAVLIIKEGKVDKNFNGYRVDFVDTDKDLAAKLSDEDIGGVLKCVGALHTIRKVKLTHCLGIKGSGLAPLRASSTLVQLDLSLVPRDKSPNISPEPAIAKDEVIPILHSIIDANDCSLKHLQFPKKWKDEKNLFFFPKKQLTVRFLSKYNRIMNNSNVTCSAHKHINGSHGPCGGVCRGTEERLWANTSGNNIGMHNFTCYDCNDSYCQECAEEEIPSVCEQCEKKSCSECNSTMKCDTCQKTTCHGCTFIGTCEACEQTTCGDCSPVNYCDCGQYRCVDCVPFNYCDYPGCYTHNCSECEDEDPGCAKYCCGVTYCGDHRMKVMVKNGTDYCCSDCIERAASQLSDCNDNFERWVHSLEEKYGKEPVQQPSAEERFAAAMQKRESLRQRCHAVGSKLSFKQKMFEKYDQRFDSFEAELVL